MITENFGCPKCHSLAWELTSAGDFKKGNYWFHLHCSACNHDWQEKGCHPSPGEALAAKTWGNLGGKCPKCYSEGMFIISVYKCCIYFHCTRCNSDWPDIVFLPYYKALQQGATEAEAQRQAAIAERALGLSLPAPEWFKPEVEAEQIQAKRAALEAEVAKRRRETAEWYYWEHYGKQDLKQMQQGCEGAACLILLLPLLIIACIHCIYRLHI